MLVFETWAVREDEPRPCPGDHLLGRAATLVKTSMSGVPAASLPVRPRSWSNQLSVPSRSKRPYLLTAFSHVRKGHLRWDVACISLTSSGTAIAIICSGRPFRMVDQR